MKLKWNWRQMYNREYKESQKLSLRKNNNIDKPPGDWSRKKKKWEKTQMINMKNEKRFITADLTNIKNSE